MKFMKKILLFSLFIAAACIMGGLSLAHLMPAQLSGEGRMAAACETSGGICVKLKISNEDYIENRRLYQSYARTMLEKRAEAMELSDFSVSDLGDGQFEVKMPGAFDTNKAAEDISAAASVVFKDFSGAILINPDYPVSATAVHDSSSSASYRHYVIISFGDEAYEEVQNAAKYVASLSDGNNYIQIFTDGFKIASFYIDSKYANTGIPSADFKIYRNFSYQDAYDFAELINAANSGVSFEILNLEAVHEDTAYKFSLKIVIIFCIFAALSTIIAAFLYRFGAFIMLGTAAFFSGSFITILAVFRVGLSYSAFTGMIAAIFAFFISHTILFSSIAASFGDEKTAETAIKDGFSAVFYPVVLSNLLLFAVFTALSFIPSILQDALKAFSAGTAAGMITFLLITRFLLTLIGSFVDRRGLFNEKIF